MGALVTVVVVFTYVFPLLRISNGLDTTTVNQPITDAETIISAGGNFELGFFSPENSKHRYLGIWYKKVSKRTAVWVANRENPLNDSSGVLKVTSQGILVVLNGANRTLWSSTTSSKPAQNPNAQLLDSGNLVLKNGNDGDSEIFLWQSFDYPCNTLLPGMKFGWNRVTGLDRYLTSWKADNDPSIGTFTYGFDPSGSPQLFMKNNDSVVTFRSGPWNGIGFSGFPYMSTMIISSFKSN